MHPTTTSCTWIDRSTTPGRRRGGCSRDRHSHCRHSAYRQECGCCRSRRPPIAEAVERACADPQLDPRGGSLDDPLHWHADPAPSCSVRRDQSTHAVRDRVADQAFNVTKNCAAGRNFGTQQLLVVCCCRCEHHATRPAPCLVVMLATLLERRSPRMSQAALAVSGAAGETTVLEVAGSGRLPDVCARVCLPWRASGYATTAQSMRQVTPQLVERRTARVD